MVDDLAIRVLVTGAAGFIGSHLTDRLLNLGYDVIGFDNLSSGDIRNLEDALKNRRFQFVEGDLLDKEAVGQAISNCSLIFHLAADPEVRIGAENTAVHFKQNLEATHSLLETIRSCAMKTKLVFASTSTVYGEATLVPTPEDYGPLFPISTYGATKLGCEGLVAAFTQLIALQAVIFRLANVVGIRAKHGVVYDFIVKLRKNPKELEILGDGTQSKSYVHVDDAVNALLMACEQPFWTRPVDVYNVGSKERTDVKTIAKIVAKTMELRDVVFRTTQLTGGRAWPGDVRVMQLDISKISRKGWKNQHTGEKAVQLAAEQLYKSLS